MEMKRKTYLILIWSITLCVIVCSSTITFIKSKEIFTKVWNDVRNELEESFDFDFKFMSKNNDWNLNDNDASDVSNGISMSGMFLGCKKFNSDISRWNVSNVEDMSQMFAETKSLECSLKSWDVSKCENFKYMFYNSEYCKDLSNWKIKPDANIKHMFTNCKIYNAYKPKQ